LLGLNIQLEALMSAAENFVTELIHEMHLHFSIPRMLIARSVISARRVMLLGAPHKPSRGLRLAFNAMLLDMRHWSNEDKYFFML